MGKLCAYLARETPDRTEELTPALMEVLSFIAFRQPVTQAGIDGIFGETGKWAMVARLREMGLVGRFQEREGGFSSGRQRGFPDASLWGHWRTSGQ
ncbi:MAG: hypothetical protein EOP84_24005 [Verrucomicrobiaceae bacterium]|nr:MAG: hypothetical protein EOP84_24005 [Verrucomicrobiaceae bacterium]